VELKNVVFVDRDEFRKKELKNVCVDRDEFRKFPENVPMKQNYYLLLTWIIYVNSIAQTSSLIQNFRKGDQKIPNRKRSSQEWSDFTLQVHSELQSLQFPETTISSSLPTATSSTFCNDPYRSFLVLELGNEEQINGFAAIFQFAASALAIAHALNRTLVEIIPRDNPPVNYNQEDFIPRAINYLSLANQRTNDAWTRAPSAACGGRKLSCFFEPISACAFYPSIDSPINHIPLLDATSMSSALTQQNVRILRINSISNSRPLIMAATRGDYAPVWAKERYSCSVIPVSVSMTRVFSPCRVPLWFPAVQSFMFKPTFRIRQLLGEDVIQSMWKSGSPSFAVHIRRGDAVTLDWRSHATAEEYVYSLIPMKNSLSKAENRVYDDQNSIPQLESTLPSSASFPLYIATDSTSERYNAITYASLVGGLQPLSSPALLLFHSKKANTSEDLTEEVHVNTEQFLRAYISSSPLISRTDFDKREGEGLPEKASNSIQEFKSSNYEDFIDSLSQTAVQNGDRSQNSLLRHLTNAMSTRDMTDGVIADILALSHATFLVGTCFSQVSRLASEIRVARALQEFQETFEQVASYPQFVALDSKQCRAFTRHSYTINIDWRTTFDTWSDEY